MPTANEELQHAAINHAIDFTRYNNGVVKRLIALLNRVDADIFAQITAALERLPAESFTVERLDALLASVSQLNAQAYESLRKGLDGELRDLATYEAGYQYQLFTSTLPVQLSVASVTADAVYSAALARPMQGKLLKEWAASIEADKMARIRDTLRMGYVEGKTIAQMVSDIRGTRARGYEDGIIEIDRRNCSAVVRTATSHVASFTRDRFYQANESLIKGVKFLATLDSRTTKEWCIPRDGKMYSLEHKPVGHSLPWLAGPGRLHWNCRSTSTVVIKSWKELGIDLPEGDKSTRASLDGQAPDDLSYLDWLKKQSAARQDDIIGPMRGKLMRDGKLSPDKFYSDKGKFLTLDELREKDEKAFRTAGI